jgi:hypothetical protein
MSTRPPIRASALSGPHRRAVWTYIQSTEPALAELIQSDPAQALREEFDATPLFPRDLVDRALSAAGLPPL